MELQERELVVSSTIFVNLCENDFTVPKVATKTMNCKIVLQHKVLNVISVDCLSWVT